MLNLQHPDELLTQQQVKAITRGGTQAADSAAMEAMWQAMESGMSREEANRIFSQAYNKIVHGKETVLPIK